MQRIRIKGIFVLILLVVGPSACEFCDDVPSHFAITGLNITNLRVIYGTPDQNVPVAENESVYVGDYLLQTRYEATYYGLGESTVGSSLLADCDQRGHLGTEVGIEAIDVVTLSDFNDDYQENDTINNIILIRNDLYNNVVPIEVFIKNRSERIREEYLTMELKDAPGDDVGPCKFRIILTLKNGDVFVGDNSSVTLRRYP